LARFPGWNHPTDKDIADHIASLAWKATGTDSGRRISTFALQVAAHSDYFTQLPLFKATANGLYKTFTYECCQARGTSNDRDKESAVDESRFKELFAVWNALNCNGRLYIEVHNGVAVVKVAHQQSTNGMLVSISQRNGVLSSRITTEWVQLRCVDEVRPLIQ
jgi:hypothetical protein